MVRDTGIEPVTSSVSGKRSPAELIAPGKSRRWRRESNPCARLCRPLPHHSATPPLGLMPLHLRADDGIRTRDPHLGKVMRYQLRYIRVPRARSSPGAMQNISARWRPDTNPLFTSGIWCVQRSARLGRDAANPRPRGRHQAPSRNPRGGSRCQGGLSVGRWSPRGGGKRSPPRGGLPAAVSGESAARGEGQSTCADQRILVPADKRANLLPRSNPSNDGLVAQWESVRLTRGRSLVRYQPGPPSVYASQRRFLPIGIARWAIHGRSPFSYRGCWRALVNPPPWRGGLDAPYHDGTPGARTAPRSGDRPAPSTTR